MTIGIFGCTADPFTIAHYAIVKKVLEDGIVDEVIVAPSVVSYYRNGKTPMFNDIEKQEIVKKWFEDYAGPGKVHLHFDEFYKEDRSDRRYWKMLVDIMAKHEFTHNDCKFFTIIGRDSLNNFKTWYNWEEIYRTTPLIVVNRGGTDERGGDLDYLNVIIDKKYLDFSATKVREKLLMCTEQNPDLSKLELYLDEVAKAKEEMR